jgi:hypothetical protein
MKIKLEHVTNSSSVSFVVMGAYIEGKDIADEKVEKLMEEKKSFFGESTLNEVKSNPYEYIDYLIKGTNLEYSTGPDDYSYGDRGIYIGIEYTNMDEDETLRQFKDRVREQLKEALGNEIQVSHIEMGWEDR